jgi:phage-related protein
MAVEIKIVSDYNSKGVDAAQRDLGKLSKSTSGMGSSFGGAMKGIGAVAAVGGLAVAGVATALTAVGKAAQESVSVTKSTEAIIKATGGAANVTADQVGKLANAISSKTGIDDEQIQAAQNMILTFKNVKNAGEGQAAMFDRATQAAADLSAAGFGSLDSTAKSLGKALNDPIKGVTALSRAGVTFTAQQKDQIKALQESGDLLGAQAIVMAEVESQVGGVAEAAASPFDKLNVMLNNFMETVGVSVLPAINKIVDALGPILDQLSGPLSAVAGELATLLTGAFEQLQPVLTPLLKSIVDIVAALAGGFLSAIVAIIPALTPLVTIIGELASRIAPILAPLLGKIGALFGQLLTAVTPLLGPLADLIMNLLNNAAPILDLVIGAFSSLVTALIPVFNALSTILPLFSRLINVELAILMPTLEALLPVFTVLAETLGTELVMAIGTLMVALGGIIFASAKVASFMLKNFTQPIAENFLNMVSTLLDGAKVLASFIPIPGISDKVDQAVNAFNGLKDGVSTSIQGAIDTISTEGVAIGQEMADTGLSMFLDPTAPRAAGSTFGQNIVYGMSSAQAAALREGMALGAVFRDAATGVTPVTTPMEPPPGVTSSGADAKPEKPKDPFKDFKDGLAKSVAQLKSRTKLIAAGVPAALADSIVGAEGFKQITKRLLEGGRKAVGEFVKLWAKGSEGQAAIAAGVDAMVATIQKRIDDAKKLAQDFQKIANGFMRMVLDVRKIGTFQPAAGVPITGEGIVANLQQRLGMVREFSAALTQLAVLGLNKPSRLEILSMGPIDGLAYAQALVAAGKSTISDINTLQGQFVTPANVLGNMGAELQTNTTAAALQAATTITVSPGAVNITVNGEITAQTRQDIETAVTNAFIRVGQERRNSRRAGVK